MKLLLLLSFVGLSYAFSPGMGMGNGRKVMSHIDFFNDLRRDFAKNNSIGDMWKLKWDKNLEQEAKNFNCSDFRPRPTYRYYLNDGGDEQKHLDKLIITWLMENDHNVTAMHSMFKKWEEKSTANFLEIYNNLQRTMACHDIHCTFPKGDITVVYRKVCLFGPSNKLGYYLPIDPKAGQPAGSKCGPSGKNDNGLCVPA